jgi:hypothetical protein
MKGRNIMPALSVIEGTWEEILTHTPELSGQWVRVIVGQPDRSRSLTEDQLLDEYHSLVDLDRKSGLTQTQTARLRSVETELDDIVDRRPQVQAFYRRMEEDESKLDEILTMLKSRARDHS